jgi:hypothetical protein
MYIVNRDYICEQIEVQVEVTYTAPFRIADLIEGTIEKDIIDMRYSRAGSAYAKPTLDTRPFRVGRDPPPGDGAPPGFSQKRQTDLRLAKRSIPWSTRPESEQLRDAHFMRSPQRASRQWLAARLARA